MTPAEIAAKLTPAQQRALRDLQNGYVMHFVSWSESYKNRPFWNLVKKGLAEFGFGPKGDWLQAQGFMPTDLGRAVLAALDKEKPE
jgi:hypothetical protein